MSWTDERVAILTKMWAEGNSASQIAKELGGVTRNAVIGKVHRLGLSIRLRNCMCNVLRRDWYVECLHTFHVRIALLDFPYNRYVWKRSVHHRSSAYLCSSVGIRVFVTIESHC